MKIFQKKNDRGEFLEFIAHALQTQAPSEEERDNLQSTIYGAHSHHLVKGGGKPPKGLVEVLPEQNGWIVDVIRACQETWKQTGHSLSDDLLNPNSGMLLQDLGETIGRMERQQSGFSERKE